MELRTRIKSNRAMALTSVMSKWYATCIIPRLEKDKEPQETKQLRVGGIDGISCQHLSIDDAAAAKALGMAKSRRKNMWHGSERRPTMQVASMDIKTALDVARQKHVPKFMGRECSRLDCGRLSP